MLSLFKHHKQTKQRSYNLLAILVELDLPLERNLT